MPWTAADATSHTKEANTPKKKKTWAEVANKALEGGASEASAIKQANQVVADMSDEHAATEVLNLEQHAAKPNDDSNVTKNGAKNGDDDNDKNKKKTDDDKSGDDDDEDRNQRVPRTREGIDLLMRDMAISAKRNTYDPETRTADAVISTGARVRRNDWWSDTSWDEVLQIAPGTVRLDRLNAGASLIDGHNYWGGLSSLIGAVVPGSARMENGQLLAKLQFSRSELGARVAQDLTDGLPIKLSVGYKTHKEAIDKTTSPETRMATDWEPYEVSVVTVPAEGVGAAIRHQQRASPPNKQESATMADETKGAGATTDTPVVDTAAITAAANKRSSEILAISRQAGLDLELAEKAITDGMSVEDFRKQAFESLAARTQAQGATNGASGAANTSQQAVDFRFTPNGRLEVIRNYDEGKTAAIIEAMTTRVLSARRLPAITRPEQKAWVDFMGRTDTVIQSMRIMDGKEEPSSPQVRQYLGMGWSEIAAECLGYRGNIRTPAQAESLIERAWESGMRTRDAMLSTGDFPYIFENVLNKSLLARYQLMLPTYRQIAVERQFTDFRPHPQYRTGEFPTLQPVTETGELRAGASVDSKETVSVVPYGVIFPISRQMIVNDDMSAIDQILGSAGDTVLIFENTTFFTMMMSNPTLLQDSTAVFASGHNNLLTGGTAGPPSVSSIATMRAGMRAQKTLSGLFINVPPAIILTGPYQETAADQMITSITPTLASSVNPFSGRLRSVSDSNISDQSWYLFTEPGNVPCFVYGFLGGATGPRVRTEEPFGVQGVRTSLEHDFGVGAIDYRGAYKNNGQ